MAPEVLHEIAEAYRLVEQANRRYLALWLDHVIWAWQFWLCVALTIVPWVIWFLVRKRDSTDRILYAGFTVLILSSWLDFVGTGYGVWRYNVEVLPTIPAFVVWDFTVYPVSTMLFLQVRPATSPWVKALLFGLLAAFAVEPLFVAIDVYVPVRWEHIYSLPIYGAIYLLADKVSRRRGFAPLNADP